jgi:hypothetical protein
MMALGFGGSGRVTGYSEIILLALDAVCGNWDSSSDHEGRVD